MQGQHRFHNEMTEYTYADTSTPSLAKDVLAQCLSCMYAYYAGLPLGPYAGSAEVS